MRLRSPVSDANLLARARWDAQAFSTFYERYERPLLGYFLRRTRDPELAADLTAEVFAAVLVASERYRSESESAAGWVFTIAKNVLAMSTRRGRVEESARRQLGLLSAVELSADHLDRVHRDLAGDDWVAGLLRRLPKDQRDAVRARVLEELPYEEIAIRLQTSSLVIRKRVSRGLSRLRKELENQQL